MKKYRKLKIAVACGGTGGHIFPGLAAATELRRRGHHVTLWMAGRDVETSALEGWKGLVVSVPSEGFQSGFSLRSMGTVFRLFRAFLVCLRLMLKHRPDVVLGMGSYASFGPLMAARVLGVPRVLHEANAIPGRANKLFAKSAAATGIVFEATRHYLKRANLTETGMPLREELYAQAEMETEARETGTLRLLVMGGSLGAHALNETAADGIIAAHRKGVSLSVVHLTGREDESAVRKRYDSAGVPAEVYGFVSDMASIYRRVDFAVCRAGASSCAELALFGIPALLVPYPFAVKNHQEANARSLEKIGAADVVLQSELSAEWMAGYLENAAAKPGWVERRAGAMRSFGGRKGTAELADLTERCARR